MGDFASVVSAFVAFIALAGSYYAWKKRELRTDAVLNWGMNCIEVLQSIVIISLEGFDENRDCQIQEIRALKFRASILCEQRRIFFKNAKPHDFGIQKELAYRGYRPLILDYLVLGYQIAEYLPSASNSELTSVRKVAENNLKKFVSLLQAEVGRERTASANTSQGGDGFHLSHLLREVRFDSSFR